MEFNQEYFDNYGGQGVSYSESFERFTASAAEIKQVCDWLHLPYPKSALDLGAADGRTLVELEKIFPLERAEGIEISPYAVERKVHPGVRQGDVLEELTRNQIGSFDLVCVNFLMYLDPSKVLELMSLLDKTGHEGTLFVFTLNADVGPYLLSVFTGNTFGHAPLDPVPILGRPKVWWLETVFHFFTVLADTEYLYARKRKFSRRQFLQGSAPDCTLQYPRHKPEWEDKYAPMTIRHAQGISFDFEVVQNEDGSYIWQEIPAQRQVLPNAQVMQDVATFLRFGYAGCLTNVRFSPESEYRYIPGLFTVPMGKGFRLESDLALACLNYLDQAGTTEVE